MNTNEKGVKGLIKVIDDLQEQGYYTFPAFDDHSPVDLIAMDRQGNAIKLQIKYREDTAELRTSSVVNGKRIEIDRSLIDGWALYFKKTNQVVYIHKSVMDNRKSLVVDPSNNYGELAEWSKALVC